MRVGSGVCAPSLSSTKVSAEPIPPEHVVVVVVAVVVVMVGVLDVVDVVVVVVVVDIPL